MLPSTSTMKTSWSSASTGELPITGSVHPATNASPNACTMVVNNTRKPQKMNRWKSPASGRRSTR